MKFRIILRPGFIRFLVFGQSPPSRIALEALIFNLGSYAASLLSLSLSACSIRMVYDFDFWKAGHIPLYGNPTQSSSSSAPPPSSYGQRMYPRLGSQHGPGMAPPPAARPYGAPAPPSSCKIVSCSSALICGNFRLRVAMTFTVQIFVSDAMDSICY